VTSEQLVEKYLDQIDRHNHAGRQLKAMIAVRDRGAALKEARDMDRELKERRKRGLLHGVPYSIKVSEVISWVFPRSIVNGCLTSNVTTKSGDKLRPLPEDQFLTSSYGLGTTCGSCALDGLATTGDAAIVVRPREAGCILLGKDNLSVCAYTHETTAGLLRQF
jgi:amidase